MPWLPIKTPTTVIIKTVLLRYDLRLKKQLSIKNIIYYITTIWQYTTAATNNDLWQLDI
jgi:hypothetical protein